MERCPESNAFPEGNHSSSCAADEFIPITVSELESQCRYANELESQKDFDGAESVYERLANSQICLECIKHAKESDAQTQTISRENKENEVNKAARSILQDEKTHLLVVFTLKHYALLLARKNSYEKRLCALARLADALFIDENDTTLWIEFIKLSRATHQLYLAKTGIDFCLQTPSLVINPLIIKYAIEIYFIMSEWEKCMICINQAKTSTVSLLSMRELNAIESLIIFKMTDTFLSQSTILEPLSFVEQSFIQSLTAERQNFMVLKRSSQTSSVNTDFTLIGIEDENGSNQNVDEETEDEILIIALVDCSMRKLISTVAKILNNEKPNISKKCKFNVLMKTQAISQNQKGQSSNKLVFKKPRLFVKNDRCQTEISSDSDINQDKTTLEELQDYIIQETSTKNGLAKQAENGNTLSKEINNFADSERKKNMLSDSSDRENSVQEIIAHAKIDDAKRLAKKKMAQTVSSSLAQPHAKPFSFSVTEALKNINAASEDDSSNAQAVEDCDKLIDVFSFEDTLTSSEEEEIAVVQFVSQFNAPTPFYFMLSKLLIMIQEYCDKNSRMALKLAIGRKDQINLLKIYSAIKEHITYCNTNSNLMLFLGELACDVSISSLIRCNFCQNNRNMYCYNKELLNFQECALLFTDICVTNKSAVQENNMLLLRAFFLKSKMSILNNDFLNAQNFIKQCNSLLPRSSKIYLPHCRYERILSKSVFDAKIVLLERLISANRKLVHGIQPAVPEHTAKPRQECTLSNNVKSQDSSVANTEFVTQKNESEQSQGIKPPQQENELSFGNTEQSPSKKVSDQTNVYQQCMPSPFWQDEPLQQSAAPAKQNDHLSSRESELSQKDSNEPFQASATAQRSIGSPLPNIGSPLESVTGSNVPFAPKNGALGTITFVVSNTKNQESSFNPSPVQDNAKQSPKEYLPWSDSRSGCQSHLGRSSVENKPEFSKGEELSLLKSLFDSYKNGSDDGAQQQQSIASFKSNGELFASQPEMRTENSAKEVSEAETELFSDVHGKPKRHTAGLVASKRPRAKVGKNVENIVNKKSRNKKSGTANFEMGSPVYSSLGEMEMGHDEQKEFLLNETKGLGSQDVDGEKSSVATDSQQASNDVPLEPDNCAAMSSPNADPYNDFSWYKRYSTDGILASDVSVAISELLKRARGLSVFEAQKPPSNIGIRRKIESTLCVVTSWGMAVAGLITKKPSSVCTIHTSLNTSLTFSDEDISENDFYTKKRFNYNVLLEDIPETLYSIYDERDFYLRSNEIRDAIISIIPTAGKLSTYLNIIVNRRRITENDILKYRSYFQVVFAELMLITNGYPSISSPLQPPVYESLYTLIRSTHIALSSVHKCSFKNGYFLKAAAKFYAEMKAERAFTNAKAFFCEVGTLLSCLASRCLIRGALHPPQTRKLKLDASDIVNIMYLLPGVEAKLFEGDAFYHLVQKIDDYYDATSFVLSRWETKPALVDSSCRLEETCTHDMVISTVEEACRDLADLTPTAFFYRVLAASIFPSLFTPPKMRFVSTVHPYDYPQETPSSLVDGMLCGERDFFTTIPEQSFHVTMMTLNMLCIETMEQVPMTQGKVHSFLAALKFWMVLRSKKCHELIAKHKSLTESETEHPLLFYGSDDEADESTHENDCGAGSPTKGGKKEGRKRRRILHKSTEVILGTGIKVGKFDLNQWASACDSIFYSLDILGKEVETYIYFAEYFFFEVRESIDRLFLAPKEFRDVSPIHSDMQQCDAGKASTKKLKSIKIIGFKERFMDTKKETELFTFFHCFQYFNSRVPPDTALWNYTNMMTFLVKVYPTDEKKRAVVDLLKRSEQIIPDTYEWALYAVSAKYYFKIGDIQNALEYAKKSVAKAGPFITDSFRVLARIRIKLALNPLFTSFYLLDTYWYKNQNAVSATSPGFRRAVITDCLQMLNFTLTKDKWDTTTMILKVKCQLYLELEPINKLRTDLANFIDYTKKSYNSKTYPYLSGFEYHFSLSQIQLANLFNKLIILFLTLYVKPDEVFYYKRPKTERENIAEIREMQRKNYLFEITEHENPVPLITPFSKVTRYVAVFGGIYGNMLLMRIFERFNDSLHIIENTPHYAHFLKAFDGILQTAKNAIIKDVPEYELKERTFPNESGRVKPKEYEEGEMNTYSSTAHAKRVKHCYEKMVKEITFIEKKVKTLYKPFRNETNKSKRASNNNVDEDSDVENEME